MKTSLFTFCFLICFSCTAQGKAGHVDTLSVDFLPSFLSSSYLTIARGGDSSVIRFKRLKNRNKHTFSFDVETKVANSFTDTLWVFMKTYHFKGAIDTPHVLKRVNVLGDTVVMHEISTGTDGITVQGSFVRDQTTRKFEFWSPEKQSENYKLMVLVFDVMNSAFKAKEQEDFIERIQNNFAFGLGLKKISSSPVRYKLYGSITGNEKDELTKFFDGLPAAPNIYIDVSNLTGMGTTFYECFKEFSDTHKNVYWVDPSYEALYDLYKIGIPNAQIISDKRVVRIKKINEWFGKAITRKQQRPVVEGNN